eukprot:TRINITY_DN4521_c0_g2_i1.p1 TRINITY_DN4521_c0_g2~~TRINITY_DN4521_c0_g2_i1.p1  ORF type:complete len:409 (+),score=61.39 TRINITY_DN4521_c0_g2_i1:117-1343(+)
MSEQSNISEIYQGLRGYILSQKSRESQVFREFWTLNDCTYEAYRKYTRHVKEFGFPDHQQQEEKQRQTDKSSQHSYQSNSQQNYSHHGSIKSSDTSMLMRTVSWRSQGPLFSFKGMRAVIDDCKSAVSVLRYGRLSSSLLAWGSQEGDVFFADLQKEKNDVFEEEILSNKNDVDSQKQKIKEELINGKNHAVFSLDSQKDKSTFNDEVFNRQKDTYVFENCTNNTKQLLQTNIYDVNNNKNLSSCGNNYDTNNGNNFQTSNCDNCFCNDESNLKNKQKREEENSQNENLSSTIDDDKHNGNNNIINLLTSNCDNDFCNDESNLKNKQKREEENSQNENFCNDESNLKNKQKREEENSQNENLSSTIDDDKHNGNNNIINLLTSNCDNDFCNDESNKKQVKKRRRKQLK